MWFDASKSTYLEIEFVGGPLDGLCQTVELPRGQLPEVMVVPIKRDLLGGLVGEIPWTPGPVTSAAVYARRGKSGDSVRFHFLGARGVDEFDFVKSPNFFGRP